MASGQYSMGAGKLIGGGSPIPHNPYEYVNSNAKNYQGETKKMGIKQRIKRAIRNWASNEDKEQVVGCDPSQNYPGINIRANYPMTITVHNGNGGRVIMTNTFDKQARDWVQNMYVIHDDTDLTEEISKIVSLESLR